MNLGQPQVFGSGISRAVDFYASFTLLEPSNKDSSKRFFSLNDLINHIMIFFLDFSSEVASNSRDGRNS